MPQAAIYGCAGLSVTEDERAFFRNADPWGFIVFARNIADPEQLRALTSELCACVGRTAPVLIDQEGGRVARLRPPHWRSAPAMSLFGKAYQDDRERGLDLARRNARLLAAELRAVGVTIDCAPVLDTPQPGAHDIIGDRALATDPDGVAALGRAVMEGLLAGGVAPIVKHVPGHGRALADSHLELPRVDAAKDDLIEIDFAPFKALADAPMAMTAHVVYAAFDGAGPATTSETMVRDVIRGLIGFDGLLMTDDLSMKALGGPMAERVRASLAAGCDLILHCNGDMTEMREIADAAPALSGEAARRAQAAERSIPAAVDPIAFAEEAAALDAALAAYA